MNRQFDLSSLEHKAFGTLVDDGLFDLALGLWLALWGSLAATGNPALGGILPAVLFPIWRLARNQLTIPRAGDVRFSPARQERRLMPVLLASLGLVAAGVAVWWLSSHGDGLQSAGLTARPDRLPLGLMLAFLIAVSGLVARAPRFLAYASVVVGTFVAGPALGLSLPLRLVASGALIMAGGSIVLFRFLRNNPPLRPENNV
jgi:uncharacterized membrane protein YidH (DUF202 family)